MCQKKIKTFGKLEGQIQMLEIPYFFYGLDLKAEENFPFRF